MAIMLWVCMYSYIYVAMYDYEFQLIIAIIMIKTIFIQENLFSKMNSYV